MTTGWRIHVHVPLWQLHDGLLRVEDAYLSGLVQPLSPDGPFSEDVFLAMPGILTSLDPVPHLPIMGHVTPV